MWDVHAIQGYSTQVSTFLETLLLLVHVTAGQPARGTEITSLQHTNTVFYRNMFVEDGLVALVTTYHKGYTCSGSTKIIHRYLPREVSELVVYYIWLILPFIRKLWLLQSRQNYPAKGGRLGWQELIITDCSSSLLWPKGTEAWSSSRLTNVLRQETGWLCKASLTISTYRHVAIALSRRFLSGDGFKRDYDVEESASNQQAANTRWTAGRLYARGLEEAAGHVEARRAGFRAVSRGWHAFLGFSQPALVRKRPLQEASSTDLNKRPRNEIAETAGNSWEF